MKDVKKYIILPLMIITFLVGGCTPAPSKGEIEEAIVKHFEAKDYKVIELSLGNTNPIPISEQQYMGTPGFTVSVMTLKLEMPKETGEPWNYRKGQKVTFSNVQINIRRSTGQDKKWLISHISGVSVP